MNEFAWCRPLLRITGVLLVGLSLPSAINYTAQLANTTWQAKTMGWMFGGDRIVWFILYCAGAYAQLAIGAYLIFKGRRVLRWVLRGVDSCCVGCGYELAGTLDENCPECGLLHAPIDMGKLVLRANSNDGPQAKPPTE